MLKKLRRQFIAITMLSVVIVLTIIIGSINIANFVNTSQTLDTRLQLISLNGGSFPELTEDQLTNNNSSYTGAVQSAADETETDVLEENGSRSGEQDQRISEDMASNSQDPGSNGVRPPDLPDIQLTDSELEELDIFDVQREEIAPPEEAVEVVIPEKMMGRLERWGISQESQYNTRYFTVTISEDGTVQSTDTGKIVSVSDDQAQEYALTLYNKGKTNGFGYKSNYRYLVSTVTDSEGNCSLLYIFLECGSDLSYVRMFLAASVGISLAGLLVVFALVFFLSGKVVRPMAESYEKQKRFITDASHEIKTPLTIIDANTEIMEMMEGENEWTQSIRKQIRRLTSLTEKLVFLSRMDEENTHLDMIDFCISDAIVDVAEGFEAVAEAKGKTLDLAVEPQVTYCGDEKNLRQLVSLLLDNAMKYSSEGGRIKLKFSSSGKNKTLSVWNTVEEIDPASLDKLFDRFYRVDSSHNSKTGGFGIGLSVAQAIVLAHKGKISARSEDGKSIEFVIVLPS